MKPKALKNKCIFIIGFIIVENIMFIIYQFLLYGSMSTAFSGILTALAISIVTLGAIFSSNMIWSLAKDKEKCQQYEMQIRNYEQIVLELRAQRHDFQNHLVVISALLQMGAYDNAIQYMNNILDDITGIFGLGTLKRPEIAAVLMAKVNEAYMKGINVQLDVTASLDMLKADIIDVTRILINLLDNAIFALSQQSSENKKLSISIKENELHCIFAITNNIPVIPLEIRQRIWEKGFTTKGNKSGGLGLYVVQKLVRKNGGKIIFSSDEQNGTMFKIILPVSRYG